MKTLEDLVLGDFVSFAYGFSMDTYYVKQNNVESRTLSCGSTRWLPEATIVVAYGQLEKEGWVYYGPGKYRWWARFFCASPWRFKRKGVIL